MTDNSEKRTLMIAPTPFFSNRGTHIRIFEEAKALIRRGHTVHIVTYHLGENPFHDLDVHIHRIPPLLFWYRKTEAGSNWQKIFLDILLVGKAIGVALSVHPHIVYSHHHEGALIGWITKRLLFWRRMKLVSDFHSTLTAEMISDQYLRFDFLQKIFQAIEHRIQRLPDLCITSSDALAHILKQDNTNVRTVYDAVDADAYAHLPPQNECREKYHLPAELPIVVYTGSFVHNKGIDLLLKAIPLVLAQTKNVHFVLGGSPKERIVSLLRQDRVQEHVSIVSPLSFNDLPQLLRASTIGVDPKMNEGIGQASGKILHYMASGLPVVCCRRQVNETYLGDGAEYIEPTPEGVARGILALLQHKERAQTMSEKNRVRVKRFSLEQLSYQLDMAIQSL